MIKRTTSGRFALDQCRKLTVPQPVKFELIVNMKTAKVLGLAVPASLLATAAEAIE